MTIIADFVARITSNAPAFVTVKQAWTLKPVENFDETLPAAYPYLGGIASEESGFFTDGIQAQETRVGVLIVCDADDLEDRRVEIQTALVGWEPVTGGDLVEHAAGDILDIVGGVVWWSETYEFRTWIRED